ncbi:hypothetical protein [Acinetobacter seifertii]|uniref:hypothetical protein n=1 Tax=Acinetobacter seifertii TaxID=1530123 RepID=UPI001CC31677|nr:hypothetical protein [Acinetobacter seifertii]
MKLNGLLTLNHQHVRHPFCRELIRDRLRFIPENQIDWFGEQLSYFLQDFEKRTGRKFEEYEYKISSPFKWQEDSI